MYEYHSDSESLTFVQTICDDVVWDSYITEAFGDPFLFTTSQGDYQLDIYRWDTGTERFVPHREYHSDHPNSRLGGAVFEYKSEYYYPAQDCSRNYGSAIDIKRIDYRNGEFVTITIKHLVSPHPGYQFGMHTLNEYNGLVVIDVKGYRFGRVGACIAKLVELKRLLRWI